MTGEQLQAFGDFWTEQKLQILTEYLSAYNNALKNKPFRRTYINAFAGTGYREQRKAIHRVKGFFAELEEAEPQAFLKGSAKRALEIEPGFHEYVFVESDPRKTAELEKLRVAHPDKADMIEIVQGEANAFVQDYCARDRWRGHRAVLFLDPFATQTEWETLVAVAGTHAIDVWILFPLMAVNRLLANDHTKACREPLNRVFGTPDWFEEFYQIRVRRDFFEGSLEEITKACDFARIGRFFRARLKGIFAGVAETPCVFRNSGGTPLFHFFFAVANEKGAPTALRIANHLLKKMGS